MERALELLTNVGEDGFGRIYPKWLPGFAPLTVLAALRAEIEARKLGAGPRHALTCKDGTGATCSWSAHWLAGQPEPALFAGVRPTPGEPPASSIATV
jgi:hypothetical protein